MYSFSSLSAHHCLIDSKMDASVKKLILETGPAYINHCQVTGVYGNIKASFRYALFLSMTTTSVLLIAVDDL